MNIFDIEFQYDQLPWNTQSMGSVLTTVNYDEGGY